MSIMLLASVPPELQQAFLQHVRDFDAAHPGCHFKIAVDAPDVPLASMIEMLGRIEPPFDHLAKLPKLRKTRPNSPGDAP
jgi:hypothetical protein